MPKKVVPAARSRKVPEHETVVAAAQAAGRRGAAEARAWLQDNARHLRELPSTKGGGFLGGLKKSGMSKTGTVGLTVDREKQRAAKRKLSRARVPRRNHLGWVGIHVSPMAQADEQTPDTIARAHVPPDEMQRDMIKRLRELLSKAEEPFESHRWIRPGQETPAWLAQLDGHRSRQAIEQVRAAYAAAFGVDALPEHRWKERLLEAVCRALQVIHGDTRARDWNDGEIKKVGVTRGSSGRTIRAWLAKVCPHVPADLTAEQIEGVIQSSTLNKRGGGAKKTGSKRHYEAVVAELIAKLE
ncbi:MAG: hypothetical protein ABJB12_03805 [Pseudomonadota bacterium]